MPDYGRWNQSVITDGSGIVFTRNNDYQGRVVIEDNLAFDNGINGVVVQKTNEADVRVDNNRIFDNGKTRKD